MKKIISLFKREYEGNRKVYNCYVPGTEWVVAGEGVATRKWDGLAVLIENGKVYKRYDAKSGRTPPKDFIPTQPSADPITGHWPGWVPAEGPGSAHIYEAIENFKEQYPEGFPNGTYEVCGPKIGTRHGANPERLDKQIIVPHGKDYLLDCPRTYLELMEYLRDRQIEGIVWHHPDGRMVKIKKADFPY